MTEEMFERVAAAVQRVCAVAGFGSVTIVVERGRVRRVITAVDEWLEDRQRSPGGQESAKMA